MQFLREASTPAARVEVFTHGVIPGSSHTPALGISSPGIEQGSPHGALQSWRDAMEHYVGLDVSLKLTAICIVDRTGKIECEGGCIRPGDHRGIHQVACAACHAGWACGGSNVDMAMGWVG